MSLGKSEAVRAELAHRGIFDPNGGPTLKEFRPFLDALNRESHRGAVLISCSYVDEQLRRIIRAFLVDIPEVDKLLEGYSAPLGSFSPRITAALSLGIISRTEHDDCNTLRKIRNEFAHSFTTTFSDQKIIDLSKNLFHG